MVIMLLGVFALEARRQGRLHLINFLGMDKGWTAQVSRRKNTNVAYIIDTKLPLVDSDENIKLR